MKYIWVSLMIVFSCIVLTNGLTESSEECVLHVGALFELSNHWYAPWINYFVTIVEHAFAQIDNRTDILPECSLKLIPKDTQGQIGLAAQRFFGTMAEGQPVVSLSSEITVGDSGLAARRLFEVMSEGPPVVALLGPSLSSELTVVGQISPSYNVLHMSYVGSTSSTVDRKLYSTMFKVNQIFDDLNPLRIKMMQYFGWTRVGTLFYGDDINVSHMNFFHDLLKEHNFTLVTSGVVSDENADLKPLIARMLHFDVRIIMASFRVTNVPGIVCEAYKQGMYGSHYVWVLPGPSFLPGWVSDVDYTTVDCTYEEMIMASDWFIMLDYDRFDNRDIVTVSGSTPSEVKHYFENDVAQTEYRLSASYAWVYDTAWALALGLNNSERYLNGSGLQNYTNNKYYLDAIMKGMFDVKFAGVSGPVCFDSNGGRKGITFIEKFYNDSKKRVAMYDSSTDILEWFVPVESIWAAGNIPQDRFYYKSVSVPPSIPALVIIGVGNTICMATALTFLTFNIYYRKNSNIKLSSPMINNVIIAGSIFMFVCVYISTFDYGQMLSKVVDDHVCMIRLWIMCLGFTALFGALFSKTWRVHILFRNYKFKRTTIKDWHLFGLILVLLLIDCALLISWSSLHSLQKKEIVKKTMDTLNNNNVISEIYSYCHHPSEGYWFVAMYIYKGLLLAFGTFLAWETRHVTVPALNDSKYIGFCIYNVVIVCIFGVPLMHVLSTEQVTLNFVLLSSLVMFCTTMCLCIIFIPKIKMRNKVAERFLLPTLNEQSRGPVSTISASYKSKQRDTDHIIVSEASTNMDTKRNENERGKTGPKRGEEIRNEINRLRRRMVDDTTTIERLKQELLTQTTVSKTSGNDSTQINSGE